MLYKYYDQAINIFIYATLLGLLDAKFPKIKPYLLIVRLILAIFIAVVLVTQFCLLFIEHVLYYKVPFTILSHEIKVSYIVVFLLSLYELQPLFKLIKAIRNKTLEKPIKNAEFLENSTVF